jgi:tRNA modification GTPase
MHNNLSGWDDTIAAIATPPGVGAIGVVRLSGPDAIAVGDKIFKGKKLENQPGHTLHFGHIVDDEDKVIDEVVVSLYKKPKSYTGEDVVEISGHGSPYILQKILETALTAGARQAGPGEFTQRAFLNGKMDLTEAEAVADVIAAESEAQQQAALQQLRGGFSHDLSVLRDRLIHFAALIELELDFSDEDVEFADRKQLKDLINEILIAVRSLIQSFQLGNVIKNGVRVAIIGSPNAGKSTLLNGLLNEERAIVSDRAGTTRDTIEETLNINGILFRLIDTAGIRDHSTDDIENIGIERSRQNAQKADVIIHLHDLMGKESEDEKISEWLQAYSSKVVDLYNKIDLYSTEMDKRGVDLALIENCISANNKRDIESVKELLYHKVVKEEMRIQGTVITNVRHLAALQETEKSLLAVKSALGSNVTGDLMSVDIRRALHYLGEITGQVEIDRDILGAIFSKFCIGK